MLFMLSGNVQRILGNMNLERHFVHVFRTLDNSLQMEDNQAAVNTQPLKGLACMRLQTAQGDIDRFSFQPIFEAAWTTFSPNT